MTLDYDLEDDAMMTQDPESASNGKIFTAAVTLELGENTVEVEATDLGANGGNVTTENYSVDVVGGEARTYSYDDNGNCTGYTTASGSVSYDWDAEDRLVKITQTSTGNPTLVSEFTYDGFSRWVQIVEKSNGATTSTKRFIWCGTELCEERDASNAVTRRFLSEGEQIGAAKFYFTRDHLGSVREMTGQLGLVRAQYAYDP